MCFYSSYVLLTVPIICWRENKSSLPILPDRHAIQNHPGKSNLDFQKCNQRSCCLPIAREDWAKDPIWWAAQPGGRGIKINLFWHEGPPLAVSMMEGLLLHCRLCLVEDLLASIAKFSQCNHPLHSAHAIGICNHLFGCEQRPSRSRSHALVLLLDHPPWQIEHECRKMRAIHIWWKNYSKCQICLPSSFGRIIELFRAKSEA